MLLYLQQGNKKGLRPVKILTTGTIKMRLTKKQQALFNELQQERGENLDKQIKNRISSLLNRFKKNRLSGSFIL